MIYEKLHFLASMIISEIFGVLALRIHHLRFSAYAAPPQVIYSKQEEDRPGL